MGPGVRTMLLGNAQPYAGWDLALDFRNGLYKSGDKVTADITQVPGYSYTRSGAKYEVNAAGLLVPVAAGVPAILPGVGYVSRPGYTNLLSNVVGAGAVAGTPGTQPTGWAMTNTAASGVQRTITVVGVEPATGATILDIRIFGTNNTSGTVYPTIGLGGGATVAAVQNDVMTFSAFVGIVAGSRVPGGSGFGPTLNLVERDSSNTNIGGTFSNTQIANSVSRQFVSRKVTSANAAFVNAYVDIGVVAGASVDFTLRAYLPQLNKGVFIPGPVLLDQNTIGADGMFFDRPMPQDEDWMMTASAKLPVGQDVTGTNNTERFMQFDATNTVAYLNRFNGSGVSFVVQTPAEGTVANLSRVTVVGNAGRLVLAGMRQSGGYSFQYLTQGGTQNGPAKVASKPMAPNLNRLTLGGNAFNAPLEFVGFRRGTLSDDQVRDMLARISDLASLG